MFFKFFKLYKWYQIAQRISYERLMYDQLWSCVNWIHRCSLGPCKHVRQRALKRQLTAFSWFVQTASTLTSQWDTSKLNEIKVPGLISSASSSSIERPKWTWGLLQFQYSFLVLLYNKISQNVIYKILILPSFS